MLLINSIRAPMSDSRVALARWTTNDQIEIALGELD
jgi:hypothetical protein